MRKRRTLNEGITAGLFLAPSVFGFALSLFILFLIGCYYSLMDSPVDGSFVGLRNYSDLLHNEVFRRAHG